MLTRRTFLASSFVSGSLFSLARASEGLTLAFIPQENPDKLLGDIATITSWLSVQMGFPVKGFVTFDHAAAVEALRYGDADISFMGALPFVLAEAEVGAVPLLSEVYRGSPSYSGRIFVRRDSGIKSLEELRGRDIAFADPISESGYLYPLDLLVKAGLIATPDKADAFFRRKYFAGGYQQAMQAMADGLVDAAGASQYSDLLLTPEQQAEVIWIAESSQIPSHVVISRRELSQAVSSRFTEVMLSLNAPENQHLLAYLYGPDGYVAADTAQYDGVREIAQRYGFLK